MGRADQGAVLIVGAGPTGMILALTLHRYGVPLRLIERREEPRGGSKALTLSPLSQQVLHDLGVLHEIERRAFPVRRATIVWRNQRLSAVDFRHVREAPTQFLMLPQWETEQVLRAALREAGVVSESGSELQALRHLADGGVQVVIQDARGNRESSRYRYVIGCDGARSSVRASLGLSFVGRDYPMHLLLADGVVDWDGRRDEGFYFVEKGSFAILLPLTERLHRVIVKVDGLPVSRDGPVSFETVQRALRACLGERLRVSDPVWLSAAPMYNRLADTMRQGDVFLAGDAAHLFSPLGGFGMNTGMGDAFNLGWRMGHVLRGCASERLLDGYAEERMHVARTLIAANERFTSLIAGLDQHTDAEAELWLPRMQNRPFLRNLPYSAGLSLSYEAHPSGRAGRVAVVGGLVPAWVLAGSRRHRLLVMGEAATLAQREESLRALAARYAPMLELSLLPRHRLDAKRARFWGVDELEKGNAAEPRLLFGCVRPDSYLAFLTADVCAEADLQRLLSSQHIVEEVEPCRV